MLKNIIIYTFFALPMVYFLAMVNSLGSTITCSALSRRKEQTPCCTTEVEQGVPLFTIGVSFQEAPAFL